MNPSLAGQSLNCPDCNSPVVVPGVGPPPAAAPPPQSAQGLALGALICGIISLPAACFCFGIGALLGLVGVVLGFMALSHMKKPEFSQIGRGQALGGIATGLISVVLAVLVLVFFGFTTIWAKAAQDKRDKQHDKFDQEWEKDRLELDDD